MRLDIPELRGEGGGAGGMAEAKWGAAEARKCVEGCDRIGCYNIHLNEQILRE